MARLNGIPVDPIIDVIAADVRSNRALQQSVKRLASHVVTHEKTIHPSHELMEAWYRFKENQICQR